MMASPVAVVEDTLLIVGVGLIGGSIAAAARQRGLARRIVGVGRSQDRLQAAIDCGLLDAAATDAREFAGTASFAVVCTPVNRIVADVQHLRTVLGEQAVITDAGSTKHRICEQLADAANAAPYFVGAHPIAGSEHQGFEAANPDLFERKVCVITPAAGAATEPIRRVERFWQALGMRTFAMSPAEHDRALARTSHVPHVVAASLAMATSADDLQWTGTGFRSTTRIAAGDPGLWTAILMENAAEVRGGLKQVADALQQFDAALANGDVELLQNCLAAAQTLRRHLDREPHGSADA